MKRLLVVFCLLATASFSFAANKIEMVTYFPVPYVAYSKITPKNQLDVGLTSSCQMNLGCADSGYSLRATTANLNHNRLNLNGAAAVSSANVTVGSGMGAANVDFEKNLRVGTLDKGYSLETGTMQLNSLTLFASHMKAGGALFPDCKAKSGQETISWQKLKLKDKEEVYLLCGTPVATTPDEKDCTDSSYKLAHKSECCPSAATSDDVCYQDCSEEDTFEWGSADQGIENFIGDNWKAETCNRDAEDGMQYGQCFSTVELSTGCWPIKRFAAERGFEWVAFGRYSTDPKFCTESGYTCEGAWDEYNLCFVVDGQGDIKCDWYNNEFDYMGVSQLWRCNRVPGEEKRCKNGW